MPLQITIIWLLQSDAISYGSFDSIFRVIFSFYNFSANARYIDYSLNLRHNTLLHYGRTLIIKCSGGRTNWLHLKLWDRTPLMANIRIVYKFFSWLGCLLLCIMCFPILVDALECEAFMLIENYRLCYFKQGELYLLDYVQGNQP